MSKKFIGLIDVSLLGDFLEQVKEWASGAFLSKSGGSLSGNLSGQYITGTWLQSTATSHTGKQSRVAVLDPNGWLYYRAPEEIVSDGGGVKASDLGVRIRMVTDGDGDTRPVWEV